MDRNELLSELEASLNYTFNNKETLIRAMIHSSYANENKRIKTESNERIEFLGDAVLSIIVSDYIYKNYTRLPEGELTTIRASVVCEPSLAKCAGVLNLGKYLLLGKGEELSGGRTRISILSDAFEAVIGAIYLDGGIEKAREFVLHYLADFIEKAANGTLFMDYKTQLQEIVQKRNARIHYEVVQEMGPDHNKSFEISVKVDDAVYGSGVGKSKKEAEQAAAQAAIKKLGESK